VIWIIVLIVLLVLGGVAFRGMRGNAPWGTAKPDATMGTGGRIIEPDDEDFEKPRNEGDLL
jgi:hypothetical protein